MATNQILSFLKIHKKFMIFFLFLLGGFLLSGDIAFANEPDPIVDEETTEKIIEIINFILAGAASLLGIVTSFVTIFIYPGWTNGTMFGLLDYLKEIWILVSNVVYFIFAFILIGIAFMNIIGKGEGTWELKQAMPKFIVGVLIVPFSWFFVQFILSLSAILTVGVLTLPYDAFRDKELFNEAITNGEIADMEICKHVIISITGEAPDGASVYTDANGNTISEKLFCEDDETVTVAEILDPTSATGLESSIFGITSVYTYGILKVQDLDQICANDIDSLKNIADLVFKVFFDVLFVIVYLLLMVALFLALFVRGVRLWIYIMLSPVFGLLYFFGGGEKIVSKDKFSVGEFFALAMVPVYASAALAFGLAFILVASEGLRDAASEGDNLDTLTAGGFSLTITGAHGACGTESERSPIAKLIVEIFGVVILWIAVMAALNSSKTTEAIVKPIADFGNSVGELAAKAPTYAPIIPTGSGERLSVASLPTIGSSLEAAPRQEAQRRGGEFADGLTGPAGPTQQIARELRRSTQTERENGQALETALEGMGTALFTANTQRDDMIAHINRELGLNINLGREVNPERIAAIIRDAVAENEDHGSTMLGRFQREHNGILPFITGLHSRPQEEPGDPDPAPAVAPTAANNFNLNATIIGDGAVTDARTDAMREAMGSSLTTANRPQIRAAILEMIPDSVEEDERARRADALLNALLPPTA